MTGSTAAGGTDGGVETELRRRLASLSLEQRVRLLTGADSWSLPAEPAIGLRRLVMSDGPAGVRGQRWDSSDTSANIPSAAALSASWDERRVERLGRLLAAQARLKGVDVLLAPTINLHRSPYGGRGFEAFSEDPYLTARIGAAYVRGVQAGGVAATPKHFVANDSETDRFTVDARVDERTLRELYLLPFELIIARARPWAVMAAYNSVNGTTMTEHPLLRAVLVDEWRFDGIVMTDWHAGRSTDAAGNSALDVMMPGPRGPWGDALVAAVRAGRVSAAAVDDKALRVLRLAARVGALDGIAPAAPADPPWPEQTVSADLRAAAAAGFVLARNTGGLLPLGRTDLRRVAVVGPNAATARTMGGGSATVFPPYTVSPLAGLRAALGPDVVVDDCRGVASTDRLPAAPIELVRHPGTGEPGLEVRFLAADGTVLDRESRTATHLTWSAAYTAEVRIADAPSIEVHARLRVPEAGRYQIGVSGLGDFRLTLAGEPVIDTRTAAAGDTDPAAGLMRPSQRRTAVELPADDVDLVLSYRPATTRGFGEWREPATTFQLNLAPDDGDADAELDRAVALAASADVAVVVVGTTEEVESEGFDRDSLSLPGRQDELVSRVAAANPRTVVVVNSGTPVLLPWVDEVPAVLLSWFPGQEFGNALADVLFGAVEPGGRLPMTWPASTVALPSTRPVAGALPYTEGMYIGYRDPRRDAVFPFGHGLGYTTWGYRSLEVEDRTVRVTLRNTGARAGREVIQVYLDRPDRGTVERPRRWLAGFATVDLAPGEESTVEVELPVRAFEYWDTAGSRWTTDPGPYRVRAGRSSTDLELEGSVDTTAWNGSG
jgi:beta-glucosidase